MKLPAFTPYTLHYQPNNPIVQYYMQLPNKAVLAEKLQRAIAIAREYFEQKKD